MSMIIHQRKHKDLPERFFLINQGLTLLPLRLSHAKKGISALFGVGPSQLVVVIGRSAQFVTFRFHAILTTSASFCI